MARIEYTGKPIQASTINDYYRRLDAIRTWNGRYSAISNRGSVGVGVQITSAQVMNEIFKSVVDTKNTVSFVNGVSILVPIGVTQGSFAIGKKSMAQIEKSIGMMEQACREHFSGNRNGFNSSNYGIFGSFSSNRSGFNGTNRTSNNTSFNVIGNNSNRSGYFNGHRQGYCGGNRTTNNATNRSGYNNAFRNGYHHTFNSGFFSTKWSSNDGSNFSAFGDNSAKFSKVHNGNKSGFATGKYHHHYSYWVFNWAGNGSKDVQLTGNAIKRGNFDGHNASKFSGNGKNSTNRTTVNHANRSPFHKGGYTANNDTKYTGHTIHCSGDNSSHFSSVGTSCVGNNASNYSGNATGYSSFFTSNCPVNHATNDASVNTCPSNFSGVFSGNYNVVCPSNFSNVDRKCFTVHSSYTVEGVDF